MGWVRISDDFYDHEKFSRVSALGTALWVAGIAYANRNLTDGVVRGRAIPGLVSFEGVERPVGPRAEFDMATAVSWRDAADELLAAGLWHAAGHDCPVCPAVAEGEFFIHGYLDYQPSRADVAAKAAATRKRVAEFRERKRAKERAGNADGNGVTSGVSSAVRNGPVAPHPNPNPNPNPEPSNEGSYLSSEVAVATLRPDVERLLDLLDEEIARNGGTVRSRSAKNRDAMRLLLDRDGRTAAQVEAAIRWCQADEFWRSNILSASKLREKYDQLRLAAQRTSRGSPPVALSKASRNAAEYLRIYGGDDERAGGVPALDARVRA